MIDKRLAGGAAALALAIGAFAPPVLAQPASAGARAGGSGESARTGKVAGAGSSGASAGGVAHRIGSGVGGTASRIGGTVGGTLGRGLGSVGGTVGGTVGGAFGVGRHKHARPTAPPSTP